MQNNYWKKVLVFGIMVLFLGSSIVSSINIEGDKRGNQKYQETTIKQEFESIEIDNWNYYKKITIDPVMVDDDFTDYPVLIINTSSDFSDNAQSDGDDFVFMNSDNSTKYNHELEYYNSETGELIAWVNITSLSSIDETVVWLYYGNPSAPNQENVHDTWDSHYVMVQHMNDHTSSTIKDSTINGNDGVKSSNVPLEDNGKIGKAQEFERDNSQYIVVLDDNSLDLNGHFTHEHWINIETLNTHGMILYKGGQYASTVIDYSCSFHSGNQYSCQIWDLTHNPTCYTGPNSIPYTDTWYYTATTSNKGQSGGYKAFLNGILEDSVNENTNQISNAYNLQIGRRIDDSPLYFDGCIDEIRISNIPRSAEWISTTYKNQKEPEEYIIFGEQNIVTEKPIADFEYMPSEPTEYDIVEFTDLSYDTDGTIVSWWWDFGDGYCSDLQNPVHCYYHEGNYVVNLTVTDDDWAKGSKEMSVFIVNSSNNPPPAPGISGPGNGKTGTSYTYTFESDDPDGDLLTYNVEWGDGDSSVYDTTYSGESFINSHVWDEDGSFIIKARVVDEHGATSDWAELEVTMPKSNIYNNWWFTWLLDRFPMLNHLFDILWGYIV